VKSRATEKFREQLEALPTEVNDVIFWFWIGTHAEYDELLRRLR